MFAQRFFLITGLLALGYTAFHVAARYVYQAHENRVLDHAVALSAGCASRRCPGAIASREDRDSAVENLGNR